MPRYFFHVIDGKEIIDNEGTVLAGVDEARAEAIVVSGEMLRDLGGKFWGNGQWQIRSPTKRARRYVPSRLRLTNPNRPAPGRCRYATGQSRPIHLV